MPIQHSTVFPARIRSGISRSCLAKQSNTNHCLKKFCILCKMSIVKKGITVKRNSHLARLACIWMRSEAVALDWGRTIHLYGTEPGRLLANQKWLGHELGHINQCEVRGVTGFVCSYLWEWIKHGYYNNRYEVEAREISNHLDRASIFEKYNFEIK